MKNGDRLLIKIDGATNTMDPKMRLKIMRSLVEPLRDTEYNTETQEVISYLITTGRFFEAGRLIKNIGKKP